MGRDESGRPTWTFTWLAPNDATTVTMYYGVVDGNCMMDSSGDDVRVGTVKLGSGVAMAPLAPERRRSSPDARGANRVLATLVLFPTVGIVATLRRRPRRDRRLPE
jgi:hypothetical protein